MNATIAIRGLAVGSLCAAVLLAAGCAQTGRSPAASETPSAPARATVPEGMNANGEVIDSTKLSAGSGRQVKGIDNWEGEITGKPAPGSKFASLQIGMSMKQCTDIAGMPTDKGAYMTGKAWIPFYFGSDRHRYEMVYKNQGRLIFAGGSLGDFTGGNLIWVIHNSREPGYR